MLPILAHGGAAARRRVDSARLKVSRLQSEDEQQEFETRLTLDQLQSERREVPASIHKLRHESAARRRGSVEPERSLREDTRKTTIRTGAPRAKLRHSPSSELLVSARRAGAALRLSVQQPGVVVKEGEPRPLTAGMGGRADVVIGRRPLITWVFQPLRQLEESRSDAPPAAGGRGSRP